MNELIPELKVRNVCASLGLEIALQFRALVGDVGMKQLQEALQDY